MFRLRRYALYASLTLLLLVASSCSDGKSQVAMEGYWLGAKVVFQVEDGRVHSVGGFKISCNGQDGCFGDGNRFYSDSIAIDGFEFAGIVTHVVGELTIYGEFTSPTTAVGTYSFVAAGGCCSVTDTWAAEFERGYAPPPPDIVEMESDAEQTDLVEGEEVWPEDVPDPSQFYPPSASPEQISAVNHVNQLRDHLDIPYMYELETINNAAQSHAGYFELHCSAYLQNQYSPHQENPQWTEGFSGVNFFDRMTHFGFAGSPGWEVMAFVGNPMVAVDSWVETLYHRIPFVHPNAFEMGYGMVKGGCYNWSQGTDVMNFSRLNTVPVDLPVAYPYPGQTDVYPSWDGMESPQPPIPNGGYPSGTIITLTFPNSGQFKVATHALFGPSDQEIAHKWVDPANDPAGFLKRTVAMYSHSPLQDLTEYRVRMTGKWLNKDVVWEWTFTTGVKPSH